MKIIIHSLDELKELVDLVAVGLIPRDSAQTAPAAKDALVSAFSRTKQKQDKRITELDAGMAAAHYGHDLHPDAEAAAAFRDSKAKSATAGYEPATSEQIVKDIESLPAKLAAAAPKPPESPGALPNGAPELDANGRPWDEEIDSAAKTKTAKGVWTRSRRRDLTDERYNERVAELIAEHRALYAEDEPVATETHALPEAEPESPAGDEETTAAADLTALVEGCRELAAGTDGDMRALLDAAKGFIGEYGTVAFDELKRAVVPDESGNGKALPALKDPERQLLRACIDNYANFT